MKWFGRAVTAALALCVASQACAAEIKLICIPAWKASFEVLLPQFERDSGNKVTVHYAIFPDQQSRIGSGDFDVAFFARPQIDDLNKSGKTVAATTADIARTSIGVAVKSGAPKPDVTSEDAFKRTLLAAKSITYTKQSQTGVYLSRRLETLGVMDAIKNKLVLQPAGGMTTPAVAKGEAELGIVLVSDIVGTPGVDLVAPLPQSLQNYVTQTAVIGAAAKEPAASAALIKYLASPAAAVVLKAKGFDPPPG
ncbi:MAG TPA: molybdate ABC transporter substrate-binding protein [Pseudolabrys sp.]|jgi:molybdate transport system substrate-binding protein